MNRIAAAAALTVAVAGALLLFLYKKRFEMITSGGDKVEILAASSDLKLGNRLEKEGLTTRWVPEAYVENRHVRVDQADQALGARVRSHIRAGETIQWTDLATSGGRSRDLSSLIAPGMRAMAIPVNESLIFDGLLRPGDRVDTLLTVGDKKRTKTIPLIENLMVLATGNHMGSVAPGSRKKKKIRVSTVTLAVEPKQAQILGSAMRDGTLRMVLRNVDDVRILGGEDTKMTGTTLATGAAVP